MRKQFFRTVTAVALAIATMAVGGCAEQDRYGRKQSIGALGGAALGGLLGSQFGSGTGKLAMTGVGVLIGALAGSEIGKSLDRADRAAANRAVNQAQTAPIGETITWRNPESGNRGTITPIREGTSESGRYCREFQQSVTVAGKTQQGYGIACRQPDGTWRIVNQSY